jgi:hypothetical protein
MISKDKYKDTFYSNLLLMQRVKTCPDIVDLTRFCNQ